jgi:hypothetical protein
MLFKNAYIPANLKVRNYLIDLGIDGRITLK